VGTATRAYPRAPPSAIPAQRACALHTRAPLLALSHTSAPSKLVVSDGDTATRPSQRRRCSRSPGGDRHTWREPRLSLGRLDGSLGCPRHHWCRGRSVRSTRRHPALRVNSLPSAPSHTAATNSLAPVHLAVAAPRVRLVLVGSTDAGLNDPVEDRASKARPGEATVRTRPEQHSGTDTGAMVADNVLAAAR